MRNTLVSFVLTLATLLCGLVLCAQTVTLNGASNGTTVTSCAGTIYDSGGPTGNYSNDQDYSITICSDNGEAVYFIISYDVENNWDDLFVYDGPSTASPLIGSYTGAGSTSIGGSGTCLTLVFDSDGSITDPGFEIEFGCGDPPPPPPVPGCGTALPFCADAGLEFPSQTGQGPTTGIDNFGCLFTQPNPSWFFFEIGEDGNLVLEINQTTAGGVGLDIDFLAWGPFDSTEEACGNLTAGNQVDCSYSGANTEIVNIPNAIAGQVYVLLVTNFSGNSGTTVITQSGGAGGTDCDVLIECDEPTLTNSIDEECGSCDGEISIQANS